MHRLLPGLVIAASLLVGLAWAGEPRSVARIGVLPLASPTLEDALRKGLREVGYIEGTNIVIEWRRATRHDRDLKRLAADLARSDVDLIVASGSPAAQAALTSTTLPVVFAPAGDPVATGFAASLAKPGGRGTGMSIVTTELIAKRLEFIRSIVPRAQRIAYLMNSSNPVAKPQFDEAQKVARALGVHLIRVDVRSSVELDKVSRTLRASSVHATLVSGDLLFLEHKAAVVRAIHSANLPALFPVREYHDQGVLMSYGPNLTDVMRRCATYIDKILKGAKPGELPIEQVSHYEFVIDLKVARGLGIKVPQDLLLRADEVIQ